MAFDWIAIVYGSIFIGVFFGLCFLLIKKLNSHYLWIFGIIYGQAIVPKLVELTQQGASTEQIIGALLTNPVLYYDSIIWENPALAIGELILFGFVIWLTCLGFLWDKFEEKDVQFYWRILGATFMTFLVEVLIMGFGLPNFWLFVGSFIIGNWILSIILGAIFALLIIVFGMAFARYLGYLAIRKERNRRGQRRWIIDSEPPNR